MDFNVFQLMFQWFYVWLLRRTYFGRGNISFTLTVFSCKKGSSYLKPMVFLTTSYSVYILSWNWHLCHDDIKRQKPSFAPNTIFFCFHNKTCTGFYGLLDCPLIGKKWFVRRELIFGLEIFLFTSNLTNIWVESQQNLNKLEKYVSAPTIWERDCRLLEERMILL